MSIFCQISTTKCVQKKFGAEEKLNVSFSLLFTIKLFISLSNWTMTKINNHLMTNLLPTVFQQINDMR